MKLPGPFSRKSGSTSRREPVDPGNLQKTVFVAEVVFDNQATDGQ
jgi:hypothetical protein